MLISILSNASLSGSGDIITLRQALKDMSVQVKFRPGFSLTAFTFDILGGIDGTTMMSLLGTYTFTAEELSQGYTIFHIIDKPIKYIQGKIITLTGTGTCDFVTEVLGDDERI